METVYQASDPRTTPDTACAPRADIAGSRARGSLSYGDVVSDDRFPNSVDARAAAQEHRRHASDGDPIGVTGSTVGDFWQWAFGDLVTNTVRSVFAEYLVALALGVSHRPRVEWDQYDLLYRQVGIEVKAVGRVQAWTAPARVGIPRFDIAARRGWDAATNTTSPTAGRSASAWVFGECTPTVASSRLVANPDNWQFRVASTRWLDEHRPTQKSISISQLAQLIPAVSFSDLRAAVDGAIDRP